MKELWHRLSLREQRMVAAAALVVFATIAWLGLWTPMTTDITRLARDVPRMEALAAAARAQADDIVALGRTPAPARADPLPAAERVLAERNLPPAVGALDLADGRVRMSFAMVRFDALAPLLDALARTGGLVPVDITLQPRVEPGYVRADIALSARK
jgi:type II secretory pathway component PulM